MSLPEESALHNLDLWFLCQSTHLLLMKHGWLHYSSLMWVPIRDIQLKANRKQPLLDLKLVKTSKHADRCKQAQIDDMTRHDRGSQRHLHVKSTQMRTNVNNSSQLAITASCTTKFAFLTSKLLNLCCPRLSVLNTLYVKKDDRNTSDLGLVTLKPNNYIVLPKEDWSIGHSVMLVLKT